MATGKDKSCGPGLVTQIRNCTDGTIDKCRLEDIQISSTCRDADIQLPDCKRVVGNWTNIGPCTATGEDSSCGIGVMLQKRSCEDGTRDKCSDVGVERLVSCSSLPPCPKNLGDWETVGT
jgi:hypothetical protein